MSASDVEQTELGDGRTVERRPRAGSPPPTAADCQVAILTPPGRGAVATISVTGPQATARVASLFRAAAGRPFGDFPCGRIGFGHWAASGAAGEEIVVCRRAADEVEIHCHGGRRAARTVVDSLVAGGAEEISWQDLASRQAVGRIEAEARVALAAARTERAAAILLDQLRGALRSSLTEATRQIRRGHTAEAAAILRDMEEPAAVGLHLTEPWRVVLTGRPNVGKSSLINAILGFERCIVHTEPGTTRDVVTAHTALGGWPVELADTAGLRVATPWTDADESMLAEWPSAVVTHNKCDLRPAPPQDRPPGLMVSAAESLGIDTLVQEIARRLAPEPPSPGAAVLFTRPQIQAVRATQAALAAGHDDEAVLMLTGLLAK